MPDEPTPNDNEPHLSDRPRDDEPKRVTAQDLFQGEREICIEHDGEVYRLRITRRNKLILQK